jgi:hypothetical protein
MNAKPKRAKPFSANLESRKLLEKEGWTVTVVEQNISAAKGFKRFTFKRDAYGFGDLLCCSPARGIMIVQATGGGNMAHRAEKLRLEPRAAIWLASNGRIQIHDWRKLAGEKKRVCRILEVTKP